MLKGFCCIGIGFGQTEINSGTTGATLVDEFRLELLDDRPTFLDIFGRTSKNAVTRCHTQNLWQQFERDIGETHASGRKSTANCCS